MSETVYDSRITADDYIKLTQMHARAALDHNSDLEPRLFSGRIRAAAAIAADPQATVSLVTKAPHLAQQLKADATQAASGYANYTVQSPEVDEAVFGEAATRSPERVDRIRQDPVSAYVFARQRMRALAASGESPEQLHLVSLYQKEMAMVISASPSSMVELGARDPNAARHFLGDISKNGTYERPAELMPAAELARRYIDQDALTTRLMRDQASGSVAESQRGVRIGMANSLRDDPAALVAVGELAAARGRHIVGKFNADFSEARETLSEPEITYGPPGRKEQLLEELRAQKIDAGDPVDLWGALRKRIERAEVTGDGAADLALLRSMSKEAAAQVHAGGAPMVQRLVSDHPEAWQIYVADAKGGPARKSLGIEAQAPAETNVTDAFDIKERLLGQRVIAERPAEDRKQVDAIEQSGTAPQDQAKPAADGKPALKVIEGGRSQAALPSSDQTKETKLLGGVPEFSARRWSPEEGSLSGEVASQMPACLDKLRTHLWSPDAKFLALPVNEFATEKFGTRRLLVAAGGNVARELTELAVKEPDRMKALYANTVNAMIALRKTGDLQTENDKLAHDRLEMGRRAMGLVMARKGLLEPGEIAKDAYPLMSKQAESLRPEHRMDPQNLIQKGDREGHAKLLAKLAPVVKDAQKGANLGRAGVQQIDKFVDILTR